MSPRAVLSVVEDNHPPAHDPNLVALLSDIHLLDNTVRWKNGPTQSSVVLPQLVSKIAAPNADLKG